MGRAVITCRCEPSLAPILLASLYPRTISFSAGSLPLPKILPPSVVRFFAKSVTLLSLWTSTPKISPPVV